MIHTHRALVTPIIREMYALELWCLHHANHTMKKSWSDPWMNGARSGLETMFRRMQRMVNVGMIDPDKIDASQIYRRKAA